MRYLRAIFCLLLVFIASSVKAITFVGSSPSGDSFRTTSITCTVTAADLTPNGTFYFYHSDTNLFSSSTTVKLIMDTDYTMYTTSASVSYIYTGFDEGSNNWYRWGYKQGATLDVSLSVYNVIVIANEAPQITIIQPDDRGFAAGNNTYFEVVLTDEGLGIDESSINFSLVNAAGSSIFSFIGNSTNFYDSSTGKLTYLYPQQLSSATQYTLTVSAADAGYRSPYTLTTTKTALFNIRNEKIADLVPVPSPFDPGRQNCSIHYTLNTAQDNVEINIYDMSYRVVRTIIRNASRQRGENTIDTWDGKDFAGQSLANGVYFIEVSAGSDKRYSSVILMRR